MGSTIFSPLASGLLTGKYNDGIPADSRLAQEGLGWLQRGLHGDRIDRLRAYTALAAELGVAPGTLAIAWCMQNPNVSTVMLGASKLSQLLQNFEALALSQRFDPATWHRVAAVFEANA